jgi:hypothetical protein
MLPMQGLNNFVAGDFNGAGRVDAVTLSYAGQYALPFATGNRNDGFGAGTAFSYADRSVTSALSPAVPAPRRQKQPLSCAANFLCGEKPETVWPEMSPTTVRLTHRTGDEDLRNPGRSAARTSSKLFAAYRPACAYSALLITKFRSAFNQTGPAQGLQLKKHRERLANHTPVHSCLKRD